jgi:hypothetical protein
MFVCIFFVTFYLVKDETRLDAQEPEMRALAGKHHSRIFRTAMQRYELYFMGIKN